jgi:uncharacterized membrane protein YdjX (TVP38/TMEM64 family)
VPQLSASGGQGKVRAVAIVCFLAVGLGAFFLLDLQRLISFETLAAERERLKALVAANTVLAPVSLTLVYAIAVLFSLPIAAFLSVATGFLLGTVLGSIVVVTGATAGAAGLFLLARSAFGRRWRARVERFIVRFDTEFRHNAFQYLLVLRLIPIMPFFLLNIAPAFAGISFRTYVAATFLGILPGAVVFCAVGAGLDSVFASGAVPSLDMLYDPAILLPLAGLAVLAALPLLYNGWRARRQRGERHDACSPIC